ncbi:hypothetical protein NSTC731_06414 [Nostoc sp. DSM 114167]
MSLENVIHNKGICMALKFELSRLTSRVVRSDIGTRIIRAGESVTSTSGGGLGGALTWVFNGFKSLGGFIWGQLSGLFAFSWSKLWSFIVSAKQFIWNFNWNASDDELNSQIKAQWEALASQLGGTLGNAFGYFTCGIVPSALIFCFNEPLGAYVLARVGEEMAEEFLGNFGALLQSTLTLGVRILLTETFKTARKIIKSNSKVIGKYLGKNAEKLVNAWGSKDSKPWSFASAFEDGLDNTFGKEGFLRNFAEEFFEEADEACIEAGYVVANAIDSYQAMQVLSRDTVPVLGDTRYVEITPNRNVPDERIVLAGREELLRPAIIQTLTTHEQFNGRDLGTIYGTAPVEVAERRHRPEVVLKFYRKQNHNPAKGEIVEALSMQIAFRLMNKSKDDFATDAYLKVLAELIYQKFATPPFKIEKGIETYTYADHEKGYQFKLDVISQQEARRVVEQVLDLQRHSVNDDLLRRGSRRITPVNPNGERVTILGHTQHLPTHQNKGIVQFQYAYLNVGIGVAPINLVDTTGRKKNVIYRP